MKKKMQTRPRQQGKTIAMRDQLKQAEVAHIYGMDFGKLEARVMAGMQNLPRSLRMKHRMQILDASVDRMLAEKMIGDLKTTKA